MHSLVGRLPTSGPGGVPGSAIGRAATVALGSLLLAAPALAAAEDGGPDPATLEIAYTGEVLSALSGGSTQVPRYLDNLDVVAALDLEALAGIPRTSAQLYVLFNSGGRFSDDVAGDLLALSNIETGVAALRLYEAWIEHEGAGGQWSVRAGLYDLNSEFDALESAALFVGSAHGIGADISQSGENGPSIFPSTSLGVRGAVRLSERATLRAAVLDGVPNDPARPRRTVIRLNERDGALGIAEFDLSAGPSRVLVGGWAYTARLDDVRDSTIADPRQHRSAGVYVRGETLLHGQGSGGLHAFARFGVASTGPNPFATFASAGLNWKGLVPGRSQDETGLAIAHARAGAPYRTALESSGVTAARAETAVEFTHRFMVRDWLSLQPHVHYIVAPGLDRSRRDVVALGLRGAIGFVF